MRMPGFTAEMSLCTGSTYAAVLAYTHVSRPTITPAFPLGHNGLCDRCIHACIEDGHSYGYCRRYICRRYCRP